MPDTYRALFTDTGEFFSPAGYLSSQILYLMLPMLFSILAIGLGSSLIAREEQDGTLELLLARPISRGRLLISKAVAGLIIIWIVGVVSAVTVVLGSSLAGIDLSLLNIALATIPALALSMLFGAIAFVFTAFGHSIRLASIGVASLVALASYLIASLEHNVHWLRWPAKLLPYHYYHPAGISGGHFTGYEILGLTAASLIFVTFAWIGFRHRDIE